MACVWFICVNFPSMLFLPPVYNSALKKTEEDDQEEAVKKKTKTVSLPVRVKWLFG